MNARKIFKALALALAVSAIGCTQRIIIEEPASETDESSDPRVTAIANGEGEGSLANQPLYVRSGNTQPGEQESTPHPVPWNERVTPHPVPWKDRGGDDGTSPPPPSDDPAPSDPNGGKP